MGYGAAPDVYLRSGATQDLDVRTRAAWLWTRRRGIVAGRAAAAFCRPTNPDGPVELIGRVRRPGRMVSLCEMNGSPRTRSSSVGEFSVTTPVRTAWDLARHVERREAIIQLDALAAATRISGKMYSNWRDATPARGGAAVARASLWDMDGGAGSPEESQFG